MLSICRLLKSRSTRFQTVFSSFVSFSSSPSFVCFFFSLSLGDYVPFGRKEKWISRMLCATVKHLIYEMDALNKNRERNQKKKKGILFKRPHRHAKCTFWHLRALLLCQAVSSHWKRKNWDGNENINDL